MTYPWYKVDLQDFNKCLVRPGKGAEKPSYRYNTKVTFHFRTYKLPKEREDYLYLMPDEKDPPDNNSRIAARPIQEPLAEILPDNLIDDTRAMKMDPMELYIGREFRLAIWEELIKTMKIGEISRFSCPYDAVTEYPRVSRALRDMEWRKTGRFVKNHPAHLCSIAVMYGTGHPDLDALGTERCPLIFEIELLNVEQPGKYKMDHWAMTESDKSLAIPKLKEEGNKLYEEGEYEKAAVCYFDALCFTEEQIMREKPNSTMWQRHVDKKVPLLLNYAQCKLHMKEYVETIRHCSAVIQYKPDNVKAYFRRGKAYAAVWDVKEAKADFNKAVELDPTLEKTVEKEIKALMARVKEKDAEEKLRLKGKLFT